MNKKEQIIYTAANLIHQRGYNNVGIKVILDELNIPKGSFYHYFKSKEDLGIGIINMYRDMLQEELVGFDKDINSLFKLYNSYFDRLIVMDLKRGCPIGNLILELADEKEAFREALLEWYKVLEDWTSEVLEVSNIDNSRDRAKALIAAFEGTMLLVKLAKDSRHFEIFNRYTFNSIIAK